MKIYGPNQPNFNPYKNQAQHQIDNVKEVTKKDQLEISSKAKEMLETDKKESKRASYVQQIKEAIDNGAYTINHEKTAQKMIDFWSGKGGR